MRILVLIFSLLAAPAAWAVDHSPFDAFLAKYVSPHADGVNRVDYGRVSDEDHQALKAYIALIEASRPSEMAYGEKAALYINLYNALTLDVMLGHWPRGSIREIRNGFFSIGPWAKKRVQVEGQDLSLDDIEHKVLRPFMNDPRVHYAVNCASWGCPNLAAKAYRAENLEEMLEAGATAYVNHPRGAHVDEWGRLTVSTIYKWYDEDFGDSDAGIIAHLKQYAEGELRARLQTIKKISSSDYDWTVNDVNANKGDW